MFKLLSVLVLIGVAAQQAQAASFFSSLSAGSCATVPIIKDFDKARFLGVWYEQKRSNVFFEDNLKCVVATYTDRNDTIAAISIVNTGYNVVTLKDEKAEGYATVLNANEPNKLEASLNGNKPGQYSKFGKHFFWLKICIYLTFT
jgi:lipocalin